MRKRGGTRNTPGLSEELSPPNTRHLGAGRVEQGVQGLRCLGLTLWRAGLNVTGMSRLRLGPWRWRWLHLRACGKTAGPAPQPPCPAADYQLQDGQGWQWQWDQRTTHHGRNVPLPPRGPGEVQHALDELLARTRHVVVVNLRTTLQLSAPVPPGCTIMRCEAFKVTSSSSACRDCKRLRLKPSSLTTSLLSCFSVLTIAAFSCVSRARSSQAMSSASWSSEILRLAAASCASRADILDDFCEAFFLKACASASAAATC
jgi:hypothetical protein